MMYVYINTFINYDRVISGRKENNGRADPEANVFWKPHKQEHNKCSFGDGKKNHISLAHIKRTDSIVIFSVWFTRCDWLWTKRNEYIGSLMYLFHNFYASTHTFNFKIWLFCSLSQIRDTKRPILYRTVCIWIKRPGFPTKCRKYHFCPIF